MSHKKVRLYIENIAKSLGDNVAFTYARASDFNVMRDKKYPFIVLDPLSATPEYSEMSNLLFLNWSVQLAFYQLDEASSDQGQYSKILDDTHDLVLKFMSILDQNGGPTGGVEEFSSAGFGVDDQASAFNITMQPFIKVGADILTGWILGFTLQTFTPNCIDNDC